MSSSVNRPIDSLNKNAACDIFINGKKLGSSYSIHKVYTKKSINKISRAFVEIFGGEPHLNKFDEIDDGIFKIGNEILIKMGFDSKHFVVFEGLIESNSINLYSGYQSDVSKSMMKIECVDKAIKLTNSYSNKLFYDSKDSEILKSLIRKSGGLTSKISDTKIRHDVISKYNTSDWDFIVDKAKNNGFVVINSDNKISVLNPKCSKSELTISNSGKTFSFSAKQRSENQLRKLSLNTFDSFLNKKKSKLANEPVSNILNSRKLNSRELKYFTPSENEINYTQDLEINDLKKVTDSKLKFIRLKQLYGTASFLGFPSLDINSTITLEGFGKKFNGDVYVSEVSHILISGSIKTSICFGFNDNIFERKSKDLKSSHPLIEGLHIAKVIDIEKDPKNQFRVKVIIPELVEIGNNIWDSIFKYGLWAKLSSSYVSKESGFFFVPDVGTQVIVSFIANNPYQPIVLGSLHTSSQKPYKKFNNENHFKAMVFENKMFIEFDTKENKLKIGSANGNQILIDDKKSEIKISDKNKNSFYLSKKGINLKSCRDLILESSGQIKINAKSSINVNANSSISLKGSNINNSAKIKFGVNASGKAEINSKGISTIKGSIVKIN